METEKRFPEASVDFITEIDAKMNYTIVITSEARDLQLAREFRFWVYIMASRSRTLYTGMTDNLFCRVMQHKSGKIEGFTKRYIINRLVYYEEYKYVYNAIRREKQIDRTHREHESDLAGLGRGMGRADQAAETCDCRSLADCVGS